MLMTAEMVQGLNCNFWRNVLAFNAILYQQDLEQQARVAIRLKQLKEAMDALERGYLTLFKQAAHHKTEIEALENQIGILKHEAFLCLANAFETKLDGFDAILFHRAKSRFLEALHDDTFRLEALKQDFRALTHLLDQKMIREIGELFDDPIDPDVEMMHRPVQTGKTEPSDKVGDGLTQRITSYALCQTNGLARFSSTHSSPCVIIPMTQENVVATLTKQKIIPEKKPWRIRFDRRRTYNYFHSNDMRELIDAIHQWNEHAVKLSRKPAGLFEGDLQRLNPLSQRKEEEDCKHLFQTWFSDLFKPYQALDDLFQAEKKRIEKNRPFRLFRPLFSCTTRALNAWQCEVQAQQQRALEKAAQLLQRVCSDLEQGFKAIVTKNNIHHAFPKGYRDQLIDHLLKQNQRLFERYEAACEMNQTSPLFTVFQDIETQLTELKKTNRGTVEGFRLYSLPASDAQSTRAAWREEFVSGQPVIESVLLEIKKTLEAKEASIAERSFIEALFNRLLSVLDEPAALEGQESFLFVEQALECFLSLKSDELLTAIKEKLNQPLYDKLPAIRHAKEKIGLTIAERKSVLQTIKASFTRAISLATVGLEVQSAVHPLVRQSIETLLPLAAREKWTSQDDLYSRHPIETKALHCPAPDYDPNEVLAELIRMSTYHQNLRMADRHERLLDGYLTKDTYVGESALPLPQWLEEPLPTHERNLNDAKHKY